MRPETVGNHPDPADGGTVPVSLGTARRRRADRARQVADVIRQQVLQGAFGRVLPDERALATEFRVSRNTVRQALDVLRDEHLIERIPGVGTVVVAKKYAQGLDRLLGLAESLHEYGTVTNEIRMAEPARPPHVVADQLGLDGDTDAVYIERLRRLDGVPLTLDLTFVAPAIGEHLLRQDLPHHDLYPLIEQIAGQPLGTADIRLEAVNADPHSAAVLDVPRKAALLVIERLSHLADGRPVALEFIRLRGDRFTMRARPRRMSDELPAPLSSGLPDGLAGSRPEKRTNAVHDQFHEQGGVQ